MKPTRAQRIALALHGPRKPWTIAWSDEPPVIMIYPKHGCYEAMDDLDPYLDVNPSEQIVFVRGPAGMRCA